MGGMPLHTVPLSLCCRAWSCTAYLTGSGLTVPLTKAVAQSSLASARGPWFRIATPLSSRWLSGSQHTMLPWFLQHTTCLEPASERTRATGKHHLGVACTEGQRASERGTWQRAFLASFFLLSTCRSTQYRYHATANVKLDCGAPVPLLTRLRGTFSYRYTLSTCLVAGRCATSSATTHTSPSDRSSSCTWTCAPSSEHADDAIHLA